MASRRTLRNFTRIGLPIDADNHRLVTGARLRPVRARQSTLPRPIEAEVRARLIVFDWEAHAAKALTEQPWRLQVDIVAHGLWAGIGVAVAARR